MVSTFTTGNKPGTAQVGGPLKFQTQQGVSNMRRDTILEFFKSNLVPKIPERTIPIRSKTTFRNSEHKKTQYLRKKYKKFFLLKKSQSVQKPNSAKCYF